MNLTYCRIRREISENDEHMGGTCGRMINVQRSKLGMSVLPYLHLHLLHFRFNREPQGRVLRGFGKMPPIMKSQVSASLGQMSFYIHVDQGPLISHINVNGFLSCCS